MDRKTFDEKITKTMEKEKINLQTLRQSVIKEYDSRKLKSDVRYKALDKIIDFLKEKHNDLSCFSKDKNSLKCEYEEYKKKSINSAESSVINELYNQYNLLKNK